MKNDSIVEIGEEVDMPTSYGHFQAHPFPPRKSNGLEHIA